MRGVTDETKNYIIIYSTIDHLRQCDSLPLAKDGTLEAKLDSIFG